MVRIAYEGLSKSSRTELEKKNQHQRRFKETFRYRHKLIQKKKIIKFVCYLSWCKVPKR